MLFYTPGALALQNAKRRRLEETEVTQETERRELRTEPQPDHALILSLLRQHYHNFSEEEKAELKSIQESLNEAKF